MWFFRVGSRSSGGARRQSDRSAARRAAASSAITSSSVSAGGAPSRVQHASTVAGDIQEADPALQKCLHRDLVRRVQDGGRAAAGPQRLTREPQRRETHQVRLREVQPADGGQVQPRRRRSPCAPARPGYGRSGCACPASRAAPARCRRGSRPCRGSPIAGAPARSICVSSRSNRRAASISSRPLFIMVAESMLILAPIDQTGWRSAASGVALRHLLEAGGAERAAGGGQHDLFHRAAIAVGQRLEDRVVLGIDRQQGGAGLAHRAQHHLAGADQRFLVGQRDARAAADRGQRRRRARRRR